MAASVFSLEAVRYFIIQNNCKVTNHELVTRFKSFLNDPALKNQNREKFKDFVNTLATIKVDERGEKVLMLKKKYRTDDGGTLSRQERAVSEPPTSPQSGTQNSDGMSKGHSEGNMRVTYDTGPDASSIRDGNSSETLSGTSSTPSQNSLQSQPSSNDDEANASIVSVRERAQHLNRMESESEMRSAQTVVNPKKKEARTKEKEKAGDFDDDSHSSGSGYVTLDPEEKEWLVICASADYHPMHKMLTKNAQLARLKDFTNTALHWAAKHGKPEVVKLVASKYGVDVNKRTGYTPLHLAAMQGHEDIIELLVQTYKADPNMRDYSGKKAKQYLRNTASTKAQQLLLSRKLGATAGMGRSLDDSFTRSSSFRRSKQVKAISSLIHGSSSGVKAMFRSTWAGSADDLMRPGNTQTFPRILRSPSNTPPGSTESSPMIHRKATFSGPDSDLMPPPVAPLRRNKKEQASRIKDPSPEEMQRTISEPTLNGQNSGRKTYI